MIHTIRTILVYVDGSEKSMLAAQAAICIAKSLNATLYALYVVNTKILEELLKAKIFIESEEMDYEKDIEYDGKKFLFSVKDMAEQKEVEVRPLLVRGDVIEETLKAVNQYGIELLVINELEEWPTRKDYFSDIERIFRQVPCPVFVAKNADTITSMYTNLT